MVTSASGRGKEPESGVAGGSLFENRKSQGVELGPTLEFKVDPGAGAK